MLTRRRVREQEQLEARRARAAAIAAEQEALAEQERLRAKEKAAYEAAARIDREKRWRMEKENKRNLATDLEAAAAAAAARRVATEQPPSPPTPVHPTTEHGCTCLPTTTDWGADRTTADSWVGCGEAGWCDVVEGCAGAREKRLPLYHGWDYCRGANK